MAAKLGPVNVIALGNEISASGQSFCTKTRSLCTPNSAKPTATRRNSTFSNPTFSGAPFHILRIRASSGGSPTENQNSSSLQDDSIYLLKLGAGSVMGGAVIKYGSIVIPDITCPNIIQALLMISAPVVVAVLLLLGGSSKD